MYNAEKSIARALASLISSKEVIDEVIIVDDKSEDNPFPQIKMFEPFLNIRILDNEFDKGPSGARRTGLIHAVADYIGFLDADDCYTPSSLVYVAEYFKDDKELVLLQTQTIYYESGNFNADNIDFSEGSCGGTFYSRHYLIGNNLLPHESLFMAEDEYFNGIVMHHINYIGDEYRMEYYDYPVYEVHHDFEEYTSFAHGRWKDYICKYHLLSAEYKAEHCIQQNEINSRVEDDYISGVVFSWLLCCANGDKLEDCAPEFRRAVEFYEKTFRSSRERMIRWYKEDPERIDLLSEGAEDSCGDTVKISIPFDKYIREVL